MLGVTKLVLDIFYYGKGYSVCTRLLFIMVGVIQLVLDYYLL